MDTRGFTLIELLISVTILAGIMSFVGFYGIDAYERMLSRSDSSTILTALLVARADATNGICTDTSNCGAGVPHGIHIDKSSVTVFEGSQYAERFIPADITMPISGYTEISSTSDVIFAALSGETQSDATITVVENGGVAQHISINQYGAINSST